MKILLINENATVEKLVRLSAQRIGLELLAATIATDAVSGDYAWVLVDNDSLGGASVASLREKYPNAKLGFLYPKNGQRAEGYDLYIEKPFLPTELIDEFSTRGESEAADVGEELPDELPSVDDLAPFDDNGGEITLDDAIDLSGAKEALSDQPTSSAPTSDNFGATESFDLEELPEFDVPASIDQIDDAETQTPQESSAAADAVEFDMNFDDIGDLSQEASAAQEGASDAKTAVLDKEDVKEVKELLNEIDEPASKELAPQTDELSDEALGDLENTLSKEGDLELDLGENGALLDEEDLADLRKDDNDDLRFREKTPSAKETLPQEDIGADLNEPETREVEKPKIVFGEFAKTPREPKIEQNDEFKISFDEAPPEEIVSQIEADDEFFTLDEPEVARALGEEPPEPLDDEKTSAFDLSAEDLDIGDDFEKLDKTATISFGEQTVGIDETKGGDDAPKKALGNILSALPSDSLRELLDGMQLTINISFPKKK
ncbi:MAG: hypothetical protein LBF86_03630 [Helicobacteraceae bacterium]|jgi:uncharacterized membrane protein|nr:hypothetical protein [Helicobacteraceae bacterium]